MREIKFRAWDVSGKRFVPDGTVVRVTLGDNLQAELTRFILLQYTGLKDKNGKEIYEGDVLKDGDSVVKVLWGTRGVQWEGDGKYYMTGWYAKSYKPDMWGITSTFPLEGNKDYGWEVIGNIYEHPQLLN